MPKLLCFADAHIGSGLTYPGRLADHERVLEQIFHLARDRQVDGILFAGDLFHGPSITPELLDVFMRPFEQLRGEIPLLAINGNSVHDLAMKTVNALAPLRHLPGIIVSSFPDVYRFAGCNVATLPWVHPGRLIAKAGRDVGRDEVNAICADLLIDVARRGIEDCRALDANAPAILLGHGQVSGTSLPTGLPVDSLSGPVLPVEELEALGYDAIVFGDIHVPQPIGTTGLYTGSPLPLNFGEEHVEHGVWILDLGNDVVSSEFVPIESPRFVTFDHDLNDEGAVEILSEGNLEDLVGIADVTDAFVRVRFTATSEQMRHIDVAELRASLLSAGARSVKVEPQIVREQRARVAGVDEQLGEMAALEMWLQAVGYDGDQDALRDRARDLLETVA